MSYLFGKLVAMWFKSIVKKPLALLTLCVQDVKCTLKACLYTSFDGGPALRVGIRYQIFTFHSQVENNAKKEKHTLISLRVLCDANFDCHKNIITATFNYDAQSSFLT